jgi:nicotinamide-nucleotide amidase
MLLWQDRQFNVSAMSITTLKDERLADLAADVGKHLLASRRRLVTAESCTGGWIGKVLTDIPGSSAWFSGGAIAYSNELKQRLLGVDSALLAKCGAVSEPVVRAMAEGAVEKLGADISVAVSGIAGPDGGTVDKPLGTVWFAWRFRQAGELHTVADRCVFEGDRESVRRQTVEHALRRVLEL